MGHTPLGVSRLSVLSGGRMCPVCCLCDRPCVRFPHAHQVVGSEVLDGAFEGFAAGVGVLSADAALKGILAPQVDRGDAHGRWHMVRGHLLAGLVHGLTERVERELGVLRYPRRRALRAGGRRFHRFRLDHHRSSDGIAEFVLVDDDALEREGDALAFLVVG